MIEYNEFDGEFEVGYYHLDDLEISPVIPEGVSSETHHWRVERDETGRGWVIRCELIKDAT